MSIFRQILQALNLILAELRALRKDADDIETGIKELIELEQPGPPSSIRVNFNTPTHK